MNIEKCIIAHFSPTGGTKKVADAIAVIKQVPADIVEKTVFKNTKIVFDLPIDNS